MAIRGEASRVAGLQEDGGGTDSPKARDVEETLDRSQGQQHLLEELLELLDLAREDFDLLLVQAGLQGRKRA